MEFWRSCGTLTVDLENPVNILRCLVLWCVCVAPVWDFACGMTLDRLYLFTHSQGTFLTGRDGTATKGGQWVMHPSLMT
jgi:hypothetical protein